MLRKLQSLRKKESGFTIVEVMIVLAIAGLIMLIVFLALPALQRNSRNTKRASDGTRIAALVQECMNNRNNTVASCDDATKINWTAAEMGELSTSPSFITSGSTAPTSGTGQAGIWFGRTCVADASTSTGSTNTRSYVVLYTAETTTTRCIGSGG
jgi:prepilin-type N-terminal cleavage/methylation domain-containing protein